MRRLALVAVAALGCKGKPEHHEPPANALVNEHRDQLQLPKGDGSPPKPTTGPLSSATVKALRALTYPQFIAENHGNDLQVVVVYRTVDRPKLETTVQITPCNARCVPLELDKWKAREDLKGLLPAELRAAPDTRFEIGTTEVNGVAMIFTYQVGLLGSTYVDTYAVYYNDGSNEIRVVARYADDRPVSREAMVKQASEQDLGKLAKAFLDVFTHAWA